MKEMNDIIIGAGMAVAGAIVLVLAGFSFGSGVNFQLETIRSFFSGTPSDLLPLLVPYLILSLYYMLYRLSYRLSFAGFSIFLLSSVVMIGGPGIYFVLSFILFSLLFKLIKKSSMLPLTLAIIIAAYVASGPMFGTFRTQSVKLLSDAIGDRIVEAQMELVRSMADQLSSQLPEAQKQAFMDQFVSQSQQEIEANKGELVSQMADTMMFTDAFKSWFPLVSALTVSFLLFIPSLFGDILASLVLLVLPREAMKAGQKETA